MCLLWKKFQSLHSARGNSQIVGRTFVVITNFRDGVLIKAEHTNCLITPRNPENFINTIREKLA